MKKLFFPLALVLAMCTQSCKKEATVTQAIPSQISDDEGDNLSLADSGILCYLPFNRNLKDKSGNGNNGTLVGNISYVADKFGRPNRAASFAAGNSWIELAESQFVGLTKGTIAMNFYQTENWQQMLMTKMSFNASYGSPEWYQSFILTTVPSSSASIQWNIKKTGHCSDEDWNLTMFSSNPLQLNAWNHVAVTFNDTTEQLYVNGVLVSSISKEPSAICAGGPIRLGVWWSYDPKYFTGYMDEVRIYNRSLSEKEVKRISKK